MEVSEKRKKRKKSLIQKYLVGRKKFRKEGIQKF
jgi:hypothetical protein